MESSVYYESIFSAREEVSKLETKHNTPNNQMNSLVDQAWLHNKKWEEFLSSAFDIVREYLGLGVYNRYMLFICPGNTKSSSLQLGHVAQINS
jgi:hypothetical protein